MALAKKVFQLLISSCLFIVGSEAQSNYQKDSILQYLHKSGEFQEAENNYSLFELRGPVKSVSYFSGKTSLPFETITFYPNGRIKEVEYSDWGGETVSNDRMEFDNQYRLTSITGHLFEAHFAYRNKRRSLSDLKIYDQEGTLCNYHFLYNGDDKLTTIELYMEWWYDYETKGRRNETIRYTIKNLTNDEYGNWTKREIQSDRGEIAFVTRAIRYIDPPRPLSIESETSFFCYTINNFGSVDLYEINKLTSSIDGFIPPRSSEKPYYGYKAIEVVGKRLYAIIFTGACGAPGNDCDVYYYDASKGSWHYIITCGEECQFIDGWLKAPLFTLTKEGDCTANNEYVETIKWIKLQR